MADLAKMPPPLDLTFYAPNGAPWCRFGAGFACLNGEECRNPNHRPGG